MSEAFERMKQGLMEAIAHAAGKPSQAIVHKPEPINVKAMRKQVGMTQTKFAASFGISLSTLRHWERGDRTPRGPALVLLRVVAKAPRAVLDALETFGGGLRTKDKGHLPPRGRRQHRVAPRQARHQASDEQGLLGKRARPGPEYARQSQKRRSHGRVASDGDR